MGCCCSKRKQSAPVVKDANALEEYISSSMNEWIEEDLALFRDAPHWRLVRGSGSGGVNPSMEVRRRRDPHGDANNLFWYFAGTTVDVSVGVVATLYAKWVEESTHWTKEMQQQQQLTQRCWWEHFVPHVCGVQPRTLVAAYVMSEQQSDGSYIVSCRSVPRQYYAFEGKEPITIQWHGAFWLCPVEGQAAKCRIYKLDRENQGGCFPSCTMNTEMPKFLREEVTKAFDFIQSNAASLTERYNREEKPSESSNNNNNEQAEEKVNVL